METVKLYIADLHAYNAGRLQGDWVYVHEDDTVDDLRERIQRHLDAWDAEEYAIHDYEGLPGALYSEYMDLKKVIDYKDLLIGWDRAAVEAYFELPYWRECSQPSEWAFDLDRRFRGVYSDKEEWAYEHFEQMGYNDDVPDHLERYIDHGSFARDCELGGDMDFVELGLNTVVAFDAHY